MISASAVTKRYPEGLEALKGVSFEITAGEMVFITGRSGAGKSTLFRLLAAIERPTAGSIVVNGQNLAALRNSAIPYLRRHFGLIFQDQKLLFDRSVLDNVLLPLAIALSGGEQQRLAIARAVVNRPAILLADEPTANLDADSAAVILEIFRAFHQVGVTVVISTHDAQWMAHLSPRILRLEQGRLVGESA